MSADPKGYFELLGIKPDASDVAIKRAYRSLAKKYHPDAGPDADAERFRRVANAYEVLRDPARRAAYAASAKASDDKASSGGAKKRASAKSGANAGRDRTYQAEGSSGEPAHEPVKCSRCGSVTAQPRHLAFQWATSVLIVTWLSTYTGIFCSRCAAKSSLVATLKSVLLGWWALPWGPIRTIESVFSNARGGKRRRDIDEKLQLQNAFYFARRGDHTLAASIAFNLKDASDFYVAAKAKELLASFKADARHAGRLKQAWNPGFLAYVMHIMALIAPPALAAAIWFSPTQSAAQLWSQLGSLMRVETQDDDRRTRKSDSVAGSVKKPRLPGPVTKGIPDDPPLAKPGGGSRMVTVAVPQRRPSRPDDAKYLRLANTCKKSPRNGALLERRVRFRKNGHRITIKNGSSGDAIVKVRTAAGTLAVSFFVENDKQASVTGLPDGTYKVQFATGGDLEKDCKSFFDPIPAALSGSHTMRTQRTSTRITTQHLTYTLYTVSGGNTQKLPLSKSAFEAD